MIIDLSWRSLIILNYYLFWVLCWVNYFWIINDLIFTFLNFQNLFNYFLLRLNKFLSYYLTSWNGNRDTSYWSLIINNWLVNYLFSIDWSIDLSLSNYGSLNYFLIYDWLSDNSFGDNWLRNYLLLNVWLWNYFLWLCYLWWCIKNFVGDFLKLSIVKILIIKLVIFEIFRIYWDILLERGMK